MLSRRLLMGGSGSFIVPVLVLGELSLSGSPIVVFNESTGRHYYGFPSLVKTLDGTYHCFAQRVNDHVDSALSGSGVRKSASTIAGLAAATEVEEVAAPNPGTIGAGTPFSTVLGDGRVVAHHETRDGNETLDGRKTWTRIGTWNGASFSWTAAVQVTGHGYTTWVVPGGPIVELSNGDWLLPMYGLSGSTYAAKVLTSSDEGATWTVLATLGSGSAYNWTEPYIAKLADGTLDCLIRANDASQIWRATSTNDGATWTAAANLFPGKAMPAHAELVSGIILYVSRANPNGDTIYRRSLTAGASYSGETLVDSTGTRNLYASILPETLTLAYAAYGIENSSSDGDVRIQAFADSSHY